MKGKLVALACGAVGGLVTFFFLLMFLSPAISVNAVNLACNQNCADADTIQVAMQMGRLDIVALVLTFLGLIIAILAIFAFVAVREKAALQARDAAIEWMGNNAPALLAREYAKLDSAYDEGMSNDSADNIALTFGMDPEDNSGKP